MDSYIRQKIDEINQKIKELNSLYHMAAGEAGIGSGEISIWSFLLNSGKEYSQQDFCEMLSLSKQTVNSIISVLTKKGYIYLEHVPGTRNKKVVRLTEEGVRYGNTHVKWIFEAEQRAMEETELQEISVCITMLEKYILCLRKELNTTIERKGYK